MPDDARRPAVDGPEALLADTRWLRRLAVRLVGASDADDLVQDTCVAALTSRTRVRGALRPWLTGVAMRLAALRRRTDARRIARERAAAREELQPSSAEIVERVSTHHAVVEAVLALDEPYRSTLLWRFWAGLSVPEVARRSGVPLETARTRLRRGLAELRRRLDRSWGSRSAWLGPLTDLATGTKSVAGTVLAATFGGMLLMGTKTTLAIGACALVAAALLVGSQRFDRASLPDATTSEPPTRLAATDDLESAKDPASGRLDRRPLGAATDGPVIAIRGRCVLETARRPVRGCEVVFRQASGAETPRWSVRADAAGRFSIEIARDDLPPRVKWALTTRHDRLLNAWHEVSLPDRSGSEGRAVTFDAGDLVLERGGRVHGVVIDDRGRPRSDFSLLVCRESGGQRRQLPGRRWSHEAITDRHGAFLVAAPIDPGRYSFDVVEAELIEPTQRTIENGERAYVELVVRSDEDMQRIEGIVVDAAGNPVPDTRWDYHPCRERARFGRFLRGGPDGRFVARRHSEDPSTDVQLTFYKEGFTPLTSEPVAWDTTGLRLVMTPCETKELLVIDEHGAPVTDYGIVLSSAERGGRVPELRATKLREEGRHTGGRLVLAGLQRYLHYDVLRVVPSGDAYAEPPLTVFHAPDLPAGQLIVQVARQVERQLIVRRGTRSGGATPVAGTEVQLEEPDFVAPPFPAPTRPDVARTPCILARSTTATNGTAMLTGDPRRRYTLRVLGPGHAPIALENIRLDVAEPLVVHVATGATLRGRVRPIAVVEQLTATPEERYAEQLRDAARPNLRLTLDDPLPAMPARAVRLDVPIEADGSFHVEHLVPGDYRVTLLARQLSGLLRIESGFGLGEVPALADGKDRELELDITHLALARLRGTVALDGEIVRGAVLCFLRRSESDDVQTRSARVPITDGMFEVELPGGTWDVCLAGGSLPNLVPWNAPLQMTAGNGRVMNFAFTTRDVHLECRDAETGAPLIGVALRLVHERDLHADRPIHVTSKADAVARARLPAGRWDVRVFDASAAGRRQAGAPRAQPTAVASLPVSIGEERLRVDLPIPRSAGYR